LFVRDFIHVPQPFEDVAPRFAPDASWLLPIAEAACAVGEEVLSALGGESFAANAGYPSAAAARIEIGPVRSHASSLLVPLWFVGARAGLPDLNGDLEIAPVGRSRSLVAFGATYPRPARELAAAALVDRATEAGVRSFLNGIALALAATEARS